MQEYRRNKTGGAWHQKSRCVSRLRRRVGVLKQMLMESERVNSVREPLLVLSGDGHKFQEIYTELQQAGFPRNEMLSLPNKATGFRWIGLFSGRNRFFRNLSAWFYLGIRAGRKLDPYFEVICLYAVFLREISKRPRAFWLVIGDLSPQQIALAAAVREAGHGVISWQYDYLDFKTFPVKPDVAVVLNNAGVDLARMTESDKAQGRVVWRHPIERCQVQLDGLFNKPVGVLLNAFADMQVLNERLVDVSRVLGKSLHLRLHPRSELHRYDFPDELVLRPAGESLEVFVASVGLIICGNTSAQFKALCLGGPVVQIPGLDPISFDHHGYVSKGLVCGIRNISDLSIEAVRKFYLRPAFNQRIEEVLGRESQLRRHSLSSFRGLTDLQC